MIPSDAHLTDCAGVRILGSLRAIDTQMVRGSSPYGPLISRGKQKAPGGRKATSAAQRLMEPEHPVRPQSRRSRCQDRLPTLSLVL